MAIGRIDIAESYKAAADLSAKQFHVVKPTANPDEVAACNNAADIGCGILQNKPLAGEAASVGLIGPSKAVTDGSGTAIGVGDWLGTNNAGKLVKKTANNDFIIARSNGVSTADGTLINVTMTGGFYLGA